jgi:hypothetical protein
MSLIILKELGKMPLKLREKVVFAYIFMQIVYLGMGDCFSKT